MNFHYIIDIDKELACIAGQYDGHDSIITFNLAKIDSIPEYISVETHEILHLLFDELEGTNEDQDHYIIRRVMWGTL